MQSCTKKIYSERFQTSSDIDLNTICTGNYYNQRKFRLLKESCLITKHVAIMILFALRLPLRLPAI